MKKCTMRDSLGLSQSFDDDINQLDFSLEELKFALEKQSIGKSPGPDYIHAEFLKHLGTEALLALQNLFNLSWNNNIPAALRKSVVFPIAKKDKPQQSPDRYRPISLNSIMAKIMERMVNERMKYHLDHRGLLSAAEASFRKHQSTSQQVTRYAQAIEDGLDKGETIVAVFVDLKAAYDRICRTKMLPKLNAFGFYGKLFT